MHYRDWFKSKRTLYIERWHGGLCTSRQWAPNAINCKDFYQQAPKINADQWQYDDV